MTIAPIYAPLPASSSLTEAVKEWNELVEQERGRCLTEFIGFLSTHPRLHILSEDGLLRNNPDLAIRLVDEYLKTDERVRDEERNDHE